LKQNNNEEQKIDENWEIITSIKPKKEETKPETVVEKEKEFKPKNEEEARNYAKLQEIRKKREQAAKEKEAKEKEAKK
jgi:hypothetical protein